MKYFTIKEFIKSTTASLKKLDNTPTEEHRGNLIALVENLLDPIREEWTEYCKTNHLGNPGIRVNSGYRSKALNEAVGGSKNSDHLKGCAADIVPVNGNYKAFDRFIDKMVQKYEFTQIIREKPRNDVPSWWHLSYDYNRLKKQYFTLV